MNIPIYRGKKCSDGDYIIGKSIINDEYGNIGLIDELFSAFHWDMVKWVDSSTLAIHFPDMLDSQGNKIFASLSEDGKGGDKFIWDSETFIVWFDNQALKVNATNKDNFECNCHDSLQEWFDYKSNLYDLEVLGIQE